MEYNRLQSSKIHRSPSKFDTTETATGLTWGRYRQRLLPLVCTRQLKRKIPRFG